MNKLPALLNIPARTVITVGAIILTAEFLIALLFEGLRATVLNQTGIRRWFFEFADPILLSAIIAPTLYFLICRPMRKLQTELERQLDELLRFQKVTVGRELRMKELVEENTVLRNQLAAAQLGDTQQ